MREARSEHLVPTAIKGELHEDSDGTCEYCGNPPPADTRLEYDHVLPVSRGGETIVENLVLACRPCNRSKADKTPKEWEGPFRG